MYLFVSCTNNFHLNRTQSAFWSCYYPLIAQSVSFEMLIAGMNKLLYGIPKLQD